MNGRFLTSKYASRADLEAGRPYAQLRSTNSFVLVGLEWMWNVLIGGIRNEQGGMSDHLGKARLIVGDSSQPVQDTDVRLVGEQTAYAELDDGWPQVRRTDAGVMVVFQATFAEDVANFDWHERGVTSVQGVLIDRSVEDHGRKAPGTLWTLQAELELLAGDPA